MVIPIIHTDECSKYYIRKALIKPSITLTTELQSGLGSFTIRGNEWFQVIVLLQTQPRKVCQFDEEWHPSWYCLCPCNHVRKLKIK